MSAMGLLADIHCERQLLGLSRLLQTESRQYFLPHLSIEYVRFRDIGLAQTAADRSVWEACQRERLLLVTNNRTSEGDDSLERVLSASNTESSLPVITIGNLNRLETDPEYAELAADRLMTLLFDLEVRIGAGRLFIP